MDAREVSLQALYACHKQGGWSDGVLKKQLAQHGADRRDAALATQLCFGAVSYTHLDVYKRQALSRYEGFTEEGAQPL